MAEKKYVLAIDQSTQGTKGILFDAEGRLICRRDIAHEQIVNEKGWVSHDLDEIYRNTLQVVQDVVTEAGIAKGEAFATDVSNASRTQLFNITDLKWDEEICGWFSVDVKTLPEVRDSNAFYGKTDFEGFFAEPIPILGVIGDSQGALYGQNCREKGLVKATYGTGSSVMMHAGDKPIVLDNGMVTSIAWGMDGKVSYVLEGNINYAGATVSWLKDNLGIITSAGETEAMAFAANPTDETYLIPAFSGLGAPYWKVDAKAMLYGMSRTTGKNEIVCAALESIAYQIADIVEGMQYDKGISKSVLRVDGGATENAYLMQFQSDILQKKVEVSACQEASAYGAALLSGEKAEIYDDKVLSDLRACQVYEPKMPESKRQEKWQGWRNAMEKVLR